MSFIPGFEGTVSPLCYMYLISLSVGAKSPSPMTDGPATYGPFCFCLWFLQLQLYWELTAEDLRTETIQLVDHLNRVERLREEPKILKSERDRLFRHICEFGHWRGGCIGFTQLHPWHHVPTNNSYSGLSRAVQRLMIRPVAVSVSISVR